MAQSREKHLPNTRKVHLTQWYSREKHLLNIHLAPAAVCQDLSIEWPVRWQIWEMLSIDSVGGNGSNQYQSWVMAKFDPLFLARQPSCKPWRYANVSKKLKIAFKLKFYFLLQSSKSLQRWLQRRKVEQVCNNVWRTSHCSQTIVATCCGSQVVVMVSSLLWHVVFRLLSFEMDPVFMFVFVSLIVFVFVSLFSNCIDESKSCVSWASTTWVGRTCLRAAQTLVI